MEKVKSVTKSGWHPSGKDGKKESWRGDFKGINQVAGWVGKGKNTQVERASEHQSRPLESLKNPDVFGPPPKNVNYHGPAAISNSKIGSGAPPIADKIRVKEGDERLEVLAGEEASIRRGPPVPYRADTSGPPSSNPPQPPARRLGTEVLTATPSTNSFTKPKPKPSLPPRLPPKQGSLTSQEPTSPPPPYSESPKQENGSHTVINQGPLNRLGSAGISVPDLGIGGSAKSNFWRNQPSVDDETVTSDKVANQSSQLSELQSRFSKVSTEPSNDQVPSQGTTWAQKQAALKTASSFRDDPSSISLADAKTTISTANNFRERHGEQVAEGWKKTNSLNKKYNLMDKFNGYASDDANSSQNDAGFSDVNDQSMSSLNRKPPPPPPPKRFGSSSASSPPPIPLASKPR